MSPDALHVLLKSRFREVFGEPDQGLGCETQWSVRPFRGASSVNILISGSHHQSVWVFDPHAPRDALHRWPIVERSQIDEVIVTIFDRLGSIVGNRIPSPPSAVSTRDQQQWDRGALDLLYAVKYSHLHGLASRSAQSTTARRQQMVRAAHNAQPSHLTHSFREMTATLPINHQTI